MRDVTVIGSGPNGLAAGLVAARAGLRVRIIEASDALGGGARTDESLESGFLIDRGAAVHPMAVASPFFRWAGLSEAVDLISPEISYGQAIHRGRAVVAYRSLDATAAGLGKGGRGWQALFRPLVERIDALSRASLDSPLHLTSDTLALARLGFRAVINGCAPASQLRTTEARALFAGVAAHSIGMSSTLASSALGLVLGSHAHAAGWPIPRGGSQAITDFLLAELLRRGVEFVTSHRVRALEEIESSVVFVSTTPQEFARIAGERLSKQAIARLSRFRFGAAVAKLDATLDGPIPWSDSGLSAAGTVHVGGSASQVRESERSVRDGVLPVRPFVLVAQPSAVDASRAPQGKHVLYAYAHVPHGWSGDVRSAVLARLEDHAPGLRDLVRVSRVTAPGDLARENSNLVGGDISSGDTSLRQLVARPSLGPHPWRTKLPGVYLCSASTAPGPGVHGMAGFHAAALALREHFGISVPTTPAAEAPG